MNELNIVGKITKDIELKTSTGGKHYCYLTVAVRRPFSSNNETDFISCVAFNKQAEILATYTSKGSNIAINGNLQVEGKKEGDQYFNTYQVMVQKVTLLDKKESKQVEEPKPSNEMGLGSTEVNANDDFEAFMKGFDS